MAQLQECDVEADRAAYVSSFGLAVLLLGTSSSLALKASSAIPSGPATHWAVLRTPSVIQIASATLLQLMSWVQHIYVLCCAALCRNGYNWTDFMWDVDFMHPIDPGMAAISDMVAYLMQQTALSLLLNPLSRADRTLLQEQIPEPMFKGGRQ
jgi:hypothetical protein